MSIHTLRLSFSPGRRGKKGDPGLPGRAATLYFRWNSAPITDSDPGGGHVAANTTVLSSISYLYFDDTEAEGAANVTDWLDSLDDSDSPSNKGRIHLMDAEDASVFLTVNVTGLVEIGATYRKVPVAYVDHAGSFEAEKSLAVSFGPAGDRGGQGLQGPSGTIVIGTVTTVPNGDPATVTNSGTPENAIFDFEIPEGPEGPEGDGDMNGPSSSADNELPLYDGTTGKLLKGSGTVVTTAGRALLDDATAADQRTTIGAAARAQDDFMSFLIAAPSNQDYRLVVNLPFAVTVTEVTTRAVSGTCTATTKINTTPLGGTANSVSTSEQSQVHASSNAAAAGDDIVTTISSNAACAFMTITIKYTRTLS